MPGKVEMKVAQKLAEQRYEAFDARRKAQALEQADSEDIVELEQISKKLKQSGK